MRQKIASSCFQILEDAALPVLERAHQLERLEQIVLRLLPENLIAHCKVINLRRETLILGATSSAWAARLRFSAPELAKQLRDQHSLELSVQVRILPQTTEAPALKRGQPKLSMQNATLLAETAKTIGHPGLQEALYRLAAKVRDF